MANFDNFNKVGTKIVSAEETKKKSNPYEKGTKEAHASTKKTKTKVTTSNRSDKTKPYGFTLKESVGEMLKDEASKTPLSASKLLNDFIEKEFDNYMAKYWGQL